MRKVVWWATGGLAAVALLLAADPAAAEIDGPCTGQINGVDIATQSSSDPSRAIDIEKGSTVDYSFSADAGVTSWSVQLSYGPYSGTVDEGTSENGLDTAAGSAPLEDFAWLGTGLYVVSGDVGLADGGSCSGAALVNVMGNPLGTALGAASAAGAAGGAAGVGILSYLAWKKAVMAILAV